MISRTKNGIRILTATALAGATIAAGTGAASAQTKTAPGAPTTAQSDGVAAKSGPIACPSGTGCVYDRTKYLHSMTSIVPKFFLNKCTRNSAYALRNNTVKSYQNRTPYKMKLYNKHFKAMRIVPPRAHHGAFSTDSKFTDYVGWICFVKP
ncbi:hypothetical protein NE236_40850 [Actinoallomurus purpureus]|uniref:hypothetical protein n=1 Tax=Actinoallomurus purpureus TaxID=478114 RepID=UPI002093CA32|nr:hypothetical protein [Actinoallomurus purpureus]MCO6011318.1 hypothetical protein [Actinoallomurus purpureus]